MALPQRAGSPSVPWFGLYRSCTNLLFGVWGLRCVREALRRNEEASPKQQTDLLHWDSASARALIGLMFGTSVVDLPIIYLAKAQPRMMLPLSAAATVWVAPCS